MKIQYASDLHLELSGNSKYVNEIPFEVTGVQMGKRKMQVFDFQALAFCWVPGAAIEIINLTKIILN